MRPSPEVVEHALRERAARAARLLLAEVEAERYPSVAELERERQIPTPRPIQREEPHR